MPEPINLYSPRAIIQCPLDIECDDGGSNFLRVKYNDVDSRIHVFVSKGIFSYIRYLIRKYLMKDSWTEVQLNKSQDLSTKKISVLLDREQLEKHPELKQCLQPIFPYLFPQSQFSNIEPIATEVQFEVESLPLTLNLIEQASQKKEEKESFVDEKVEILVDDKKIKQEYPAQVRDQQKRKKLEFRDPLSEKCHQEIVFSILEILVDVNKQPKEFDTIRSKIKKELILERMQYFINIFSNDREANELNLMPLGKQLQKCIVNIYKQITSLSELNPQLRASEEDLRFVDEIFLEKWTYLSHY